jgi:isopenicillin N synthase-like dioxygenase
MAFMNEMPLFQAQTAALWNEFDALAKVLMKFIAISMNKAEDFFQDKDGQKGYSLLRGIHYPAGREPVDDDELVMVGGNAAGMCASKHTDINMITLLLAKEPGLQLWHQGEWMPITIEDPNLIIVNCGDMLENLTNGRYVSGLHRVVCAPNKERFSIPFFFHVHDDFDISPLPQFGKPKPEHMTHRTAKAFLEYRLKQIGLLKK